MTQETNDSGIEKKFRRVGVATDVNTEIRGRHYNPRLSSKERCSRERQLTREYIKFGEAYLDSSYGFGREVTTI